MLPLWREVSYNRHHGRNMVWPNSWLHCRCCRQGMRQQLRGGEKPRPRAVCQRRYPAGTCIFLAAAALPDAVCLDNSMSLYDQSTIAWLDSFSKINYASRLRNEYLTSQCNQHTKNYLRQVGRPQRQCTLHSWMPPASQPVQLVIVVIIHVYKRCCFQFSYKNALLTVLYFSNVFFIFKNVALTSVKITEI